MREAGSHRANPILTGANCYRGGCLAAWAGGCRGCRTYFYIWTGHCPLCVFSLSKVFGTGLLFLERMSHTPSLLCTTFPKSLQPGFSPCGHCHVPRHPGQTLGVFFLSFLLPNSTATTQTICLPSSNMSGVHLFLRLHCHSVL